AGRNPMRAIQTKDYLYLWNPWSNGERKFKTATTGTTSYRTMKELAASDPAIAKRLKLFDYGTIHELYHIKSDPDCLNNVIRSAKHADARSSLQSQLLTKMSDTGDHALEAFQKRNDPKIGHFYTDKKQEEATIRRASRRKNKQPKNKSNQKLISLVAPKTATQGKEVTLIISHTISKKLGVQKVHITLKDGTKAKRLERKVITAAGKGTRKITFTLPAEITDHQISFSAFVGPDYPNNLQHVTSKPISTQK
ncbi:hypothetical protein OAF51_02430, partial [Akkermansiaceae bacterium]|nr:hypothetical protein [Akkermansiaceae bacterium]